MKKTRIIDLFQTIKKTKTSWIAILIFILTSISFNFGLGWSDDMVVSSFDQEFHDYNTRDVELFSFYGLDEDDISEIAENPDVEAAEGIHFTYADIRHDGNQQHVTVREVTENIDKLRLLEGRFPDKADEVVLDKGWAERNDIRTGDVIELLKLSSGEEKLKYDSLTVSGFVTNPAYSCSVAGTYGIDIFTGDSIDVMLYGKKEIFSEPDSAYQLVLIKGQNLGNLNFDTQEYGDRCEELADTVYAISEKKDKEKYDKLSQMMQMYGKGDVPYVEGFTQTRTALSKLVSVNIMTGIMTNTSYTLSVMFLVIALLVSYVAITRMVHLQKVQIGTKKSFGCSTFEIVLCYIAYTVTALVIGYIAGGILGVVFEYILGNNLIPVYYISVIKLYFSPSELAVIFLILLTIVTLITFGSVISICQRDAIDLLNQTEVSKVKHNWYEKLPIWNKLSLLNQTIVKNCTTDKRRVLGTLISVSCCMALFVCAVTFFYNIKFSVRTQFDRYFHFDTTVSFDEDEETAFGDISKVLKDKGLSALPVCTKTVSLEKKDHKYAKAFIFVIDDNKVSDFIKMKGYKTPDTAPFFDGIYAGHAYRSYYGDDSGNITLCLTDGTKKEIEPDGYFINYTLTEYIFMSPERYKECFDEDSKYNTFLIRSGKYSVDDIKSDLEGISGFLTCEDYIEKTSQEFLTFIIFVTAISAIYILVAVIMSFLVLKNILSQFVLEKKKELIVMKINGYDDKDTRRYILFDTILLTIIGIIPGAVTGSIVGYFAVSAFDSPTISLLKETVWISWVIGIIFTFILSLANCISAMTQIEKFDISDINK